MGIQTLLGVTGKGYKQIDRGDRWGIQTLLGITGKGYKVTGVTGKDTNMVTGDR